jgi:hypothetical protein
MRKSIDITSTKPQLEFHNLTCKYPAFIGGFGCGKSHTLVNQALIDASYGPDALIAIYEPSYDLIRLIIAPRLMGALDKAGIKYDYNKTEQHIKTKSAQFGDFILRTLDNPERIIGYESFRAHIDEIDLLSVAQAEMAWLKILGRNRQTLKNNPKAVNRVSAYSTPEGFKFMYDKWVRNATEEYQHVKASSTTNIFLREDYRNTLLKNYSPEMKKRYIDGDFVNLNTGTIYKDFDRLINTSKERIQTLNAKGEYEPEKLYIGCDFNITKMAATVFVRRNNNTEWHIVDEFCNLYDTKGMIAAIKEKYAGHKICMYPDASGRSRKTSASTSDIALLEQAGFEIRAHSVNPFVNDRINAVNMSFYNKKVFVNTDTCPRTTECLEQQAWTDKGEPDKTSGTDHQNDATGYLIAYEMPVKKLVSNYKVEYPT